ncbi:GDSL esterase/lipase, partial [Mucuna pruriens]
MHLSSCACDSPYFLDLSNPTSFVSSLAFLPRSIEMVAKTKPWPWLVLSFFLWAANCIQHCVHGESKVPCLFIFGDSLSDNGNNNLPTFAKSNFLPYGIDFPQGPTGRFTNGQTAIDIIAKLLEFENFIPPYANTSGSDILKGVNYASGAAGIRPESGKHIGANIHLGAQLINHRFIYSKIANKLGGYEKAKQYLKKCFFTKQAASIPETYAKILVDQYSQYIQEMHDELGARKFVLVGLAAIGCTPNAISTYGTNGSNCVEEISDAVSIFNDKLISLVDQFNNKFSADSKFIFARIVDDFAFLGFTIVNASCCPTLMNALCIPNEMPCQNSTEYMFWDGYHPTEAAHRIFAIRWYNGSSSNPSFTYPMDIMHLLHSL